MQCNVLSWKTSYRSRLGIEVDRKGSETYDELLSALPSLRITFCRLLCFTNNCNLWFLRRQKVKRLEGSLKGKCEGRTQSNETFATCNARQRWCFIRWFLFSWKKRVLFIIIKKNKEKFNGNQTETRFCLQLMVWWAFKLFGVKDNWKEI